MGRGQQSPLFPRFGGRYRHRYRLEIAFYLRPKHPDVPHVAFLVVPKSQRQSASKHHVLDTLVNVSGDVAQPWRYEHIEIPDMDVEARVLVRVVVAKIIVTNEELDKLFVAIPVDSQENSIASSESRFSCTSWAETAFGELRRNGALEGAASWNEAYAAGVKYLKDKLKQSRWGEQWRNGIPTLDLLQNKELVP